MTSLYHEIHVTVDKPNGTPIWIVQDFAEARGWHISEMTSAEGPPVSDELFFTTRTRSVFDAIDMINLLVDDARKEGYTIIRYKVEDAVIDSKVVDSLHLL